MFEQKRETYESRVREKRSGQKHSDVPITTLRISITRPVYKMTIIAQWVPVGMIHELSEQHLVGCVEKPSRVGLKDYDLARIQKEICQVRLEKERSQEMKVFMLGFRYCKTLIGLGYTAFIEKNPEMAIGYILKRDTDGQLYKRSRVSKATTTGSYGS